MLNNLRKMRRSKGLTQNELAFITGYTQSYISSIERGVKPPTHSVACKISKALGVRIKDIFYVDEGEIIKQKAKLIILNKNKVTRNREVNQNA